MSKPSQPMTQQSRLADLELERMPQLTELRNPDDDWTGKTKAEDRRRRQNRLNQRTYRKRKMLRKAQFPVASTGSNVGSHELTSLRWLNDESILMLKTPDLHARMYTFMKHAYQDYALRTMRPAYLPALIRLNLLNALGRNAVALGMTLRGLCRQGSTSPFSIFGPQPPNQILMVSSCPDNLRPTTTQLTVRHHPWLDLFPFPRMRDNMIDGTFNGVFHGDQLCYDLVYTGDGLDVKKPALIVWGESWDTGAWEASVEFLQKWGWLVKGSPELIESTNSWREKRGEKKLNVDLWR